MYEDLLKQYKSVMDAYAKMQEKQRMAEDDSSGGDGSAYNKYVLAKTGTLPKSYDSRLVEDVEIEQDPEVKSWADNVKKTFPHLNLKFKHRIESGTHTTSAEVPGQDRSYGVWDHDERKGYIWTEEADDNPCWDGYEMIGMKEKDGKKVPNCVKKED